MIEIASDNEPSVNAEPLFASLEDAADVCSRSSGDVYLVLDFAFDKGGSPAKVSELVLGLASLFDLRFERLLDAYSDGLKKGFPFCADLEQSIMSWWGMADDLRDALAGSQAGVLDADGFANAMLGIIALSNARQAKVKALLDGLKAGSSS